MRNASRQEQLAIQQACQHWQRPRWVLRCAMIDESTFTYDVLANTREEALRECRSDNPKAIVLGVTLHIPVKIISQ